jgi:hypothetical protein
MAKVNKLMEAAMVVLQATPQQQLNIVVLNKALFYLDLYALRDLGKVVTGQKYVALPQGPVVDQYKTRVVKSLSDAGLAKQLSSDNNAKPLRVLTPLERLHHLNADERLIAKEMGEGLNRFTSTAISTYSHDNPGWIIARQKYNSETNPAPVINMQLALQQLADEDDDTWIDEAVDETLMASLKKAEAATVPWK